MKSIYSIVLVGALTTLTPPSSYADEPVCHRCEEIREYNKTHHQNFEYYEDYLKSEEAGAPPTMCPAPKQLHPGPKPIKPPKNNAKKPLSAPAPLPESAPTKDKPLRQAP